MERMTDTLVDLINQYESSELKIKKEISDIKNEEKQKMEEAIIKRVEEVESNPYLLASREDIKFKLKNEIEVLNTRYSLTGISSFMSVNTNYLKRFMKICGAVSNKKTAKMARGKYIKNTEELGKRLDDPRKHHNSSMYDHNNK